MKTDDEYRSTMLKRRMFELQEKNKRTSKGEAMNWSAIGRCCRPPVSRHMVYLVRDGRAVSARVREVIEQELGGVFWMKQAA